MAYVALKQQLEHEHEQRVLRIYNEITEDGWRRFPGFAKANTHGNPGLDPLERQLFLRAGVTQEYFSDASWKKDGESRGLLAAAIAWQDGTSWQTEAEYCGRFVGDASDGELHGIYMALNAANKHAIVQQKGISNVIVYSDAKWVIEMLESGLDAGRGPYLGPLPADGKWILGKVYDLAGALQAAGVYTHVRWVKGHAALQGNDLADQAATRETRRQYWGVGGKYSTTTMWTNTLPAGLWARSRDFVEEANYRLSQPWFLDGRGQCYVAPRLQLSLPPPSATVDDLLEELGRSFGLIRN